MPAAPDLAAHLERLVAGQARRVRRDADPVSFVHRYKRADDREVVGLVAALLAFGNVKAIRASIERFLAHMGPRPAVAVDTRTRADWNKRLDGFVHRVYRGEHFAVVLANAGKVRRKHGSLGNAFATFLHDSDNDLREALATLADALRGPNPDRGLAHLVPDPRAGSACKRLHLYLRWMVRKEDGVDLGTWPQIDPAFLVIPVDTHIHRIANNLGLTKRATASWRTAEEITFALRKYDRADPVRYDFALCHHGISGDCPSKRDPAACAACVLKPVCRHWR